jgi:hypothetical protein
MAKIYLDEEVLKKLEAEAIRMGMAFVTPNDVLRVMLGLDVHGNYAKDEAVGKEMEIRVHPAYIRYKYIGIRKEYRQYFPEHGAKIELINNAEGSFQMKVYRYDTGTTELWDTKGGWFDKNPQLNADDKILITTIEPMKKYRLEIVKDEKTR